MEKKDARRKRRAEEDLLPLLQKRRNGFLSYAYVGNPEVMMSLFPDCDFRIIPNLSLIHIYHPVGTPRRKAWPVGQVVKTAASHAVNIGSNPVRVTIPKKQCFFGNP